MTWRNDFSNWLPRSNESMGVGNNRSRPGRTPPSVGPKRPNASILTFFKKVENDPSLFVQPRNGQPPMHQYTDLEPHQDDWADNTVCKRRKLEASSEEQACVEIARGSPLICRPEDAAALSIETGLPQPRARGPFLVDSSSDDAGSPEKDGTDSASPTRPSIGLSIDRSRNIRIDSGLPGPAKPNDPDSLTNEHPDDDFVDYADFGDSNESDNAGNEDSDNIEGDVDETHGQDVDTELTQKFDIEPSEFGMSACPVCSGSLVGFSSHEATVHVNSCLDGDTPSALIPAETQSLAVVGTLVSDLVGNTSDQPPKSGRAALAAIARPGQADPFRPSSTAEDNDGIAKTGASSAFAKIMSGHAEKAAWATAAAAEQESRGKAAYQRTCPFYKIMPGFSICVDAFRYGAVEGCSAYFLSHFHSDHYIGLSSSWCHGPIYCSRITGALVKQQLRVAAKWLVELEFDRRADIPGTGGATVSMIPANHCPGSSLFLFEKPIATRLQRILHCGDFRACAAHVLHPLLRPDIASAIAGSSPQQHKIDICYLDTTYLDPRFSFPPQPEVIGACAELCFRLSTDQDDGGHALPAARKRSLSVSRYLNPGLAKATGLPSDKPTALVQLGEEKTSSNPKQRLLVVCGTYSIGKERIAKAIANALSSKIYAPPGKMRICALLNDAELTALLTSDPLDAQVHMLPLMKIQADTLQEYLNGLKPHFSCIVGFRPTGWTYRPAGAKVAKLSPGSLPIVDLLHGPAWRPRFLSSNMVAQRGSTREAKCFGVPYSEHSSFRELTLFVMGLRIDRIVPTVNVGSQASRQRMKAWIDRWIAERRRGGLVLPLEGVGNKSSLWEGSDGNGGGVWW